VDFTHVGSVKGSAAIRGDTGYLEVGTDSSAEKLYWPGNWWLGDMALSSDWSSYLFKSFERCWRRFWSCGLEQWWKCKTNEDIWMLMMINCSKPG